ncbi:hypothetical protein Golomagni_06627 [Golovinomyces magnicellulatus]|nr:hypothetical protein Golomagni_06627 [Golovinomyces magnicellulatus]
MVCSKCQKLAKGTALATPGVKKKSEMYYGSSASTKTGSKSATLGQTGIGKSKLLSKSAKNPYAQYSRCAYLPLSSVCLNNPTANLCFSSCSKCKAKVTQGHSLCQPCAYKGDASFNSQVTACAMCGKPNKKASSKAPAVAGQKFTMK